MLYLPSFGTSPIEQFSVIDEFDGYHGQAFLAFKQTISSAKRPLDEFLMGFGIMIPPRNACISEDIEEKEAFATTSTVEPRELNVFVLGTIAHVEVTWVDTLSIHMEYNKALNTLYLFRYPSFCAANIPQTYDDHSTKGIIHR